MENHLADIQWVRLAMAIDCEGCICISKNGPKYYSLCVSISNTDVRLIDWARYEFGFGKVALQGRADSNLPTARKPRFSTYKQAYKAYSQSHHAAWILENVKPYLLIKREQAEIAMEFQATILTSQVGVACNKRVAPDIQYIREQLYLRLKALH